MRLDVYLVTHQLAESREKAQQLIKKGAVKVNDTIILKASYEIDEQARVDVQKEVLKYVSRGGYKLEKALSAFSINVSNLRIIDAGSSTGGFTDCLIQHGASKVYAVDVGTGQLHPSLHKHAQVVSLENRDIRSITLEDLESEKADALVADLSFISLEKVIDSFLQLTKTDSWWVLLMKPQFETGVKRNFKKGIIKSKDAREQILNNVIKLLENNQLFIKGICPTSVEEKQKNVEYLIYVQRHTI